MKDQLTLMEEIKRLKTERNAIILAHNYQREEIQDVADLVGDSFALSQKAASTDADVIVFCGVHFMAESAAILAPHKTVLLPELQAGCPMAEMVDADTLREKKSQHPNATVVCYVNSSAAVKAECDICCTSSNAVQVVESIDNEEIIFVPDRNLGNYVSMRTGKKLILWEGFCWTHEQITKEDVLEAKAKYPDAEVLVHPECVPEVVALADKAFSTSGIIKYVQESNRKNFIIGTEMGILHQLKKNDPDKNYYILSDKMMCPNMKLTTLEKLHRCLENMEPVIKVPEDIRVKAQRALERMLAIK